MVANCFFTADSTWKVQVSKSLSVLDNAELKLLNNATVKIFEENVLIDSITEPTEDGWYRSSASPKRGKQYNLIVKSPDFNSEITASNKIPKAVKIESAKLFVTDTFFYSDPYYSHGNMEGSFEIVFTDPGEEDNYYKLSIFSYDSIFDYSGMKPEFSHLQPRYIAVSSEDPVLESGGSYNNLFLFDDQLFNNRKVSLKIDVNDYNASRDMLYYLELVSLTRAGYLYRKTTKEYDLARNDPFAEPVMIYSNIQNGFGIFAGHSTYVQPFDPPY